MADDTVAAPAAAPAKKAKKPSKPKTAPTHPKVKDMVKAAIAANKDRKGSSLPTIKKYIAANYKVDVTKLSAFIRRALVTGTDSGAFVRVGGKGKGASGSFKLGEKTKKAPKDKPKKATTTATKIKKPATKKPKAKKSPKKPKAPKAKKPAAAKKPKTPKKAKSPAKKPAAKKAKTPKKAAAKK